MFSNPWMLWSIAIGMPLALVIMIVYISKSSDK